MTPKQKRTYKKHFAIYECKNKYPELSWQEIRERFGYASYTNLSRIYNKVKHHLETGEPYYKPKSKRKKYHVMTNKERAEVMVAKPEVKNDIAYMAKLGVRF